MTYRYKKKKEINSLTSRGISVLHPLQSQSDSTNLSLRLPFIPVSGWLMEVLRQIVSPTMGKSKYSHCRKSRVFTTWENLIRLTSRTEYCGTPGQNSSKTHKNWTASGKPGQSGSLP